MIDQYKAYSLKRNYFRFYFLLDIAHPKIIHETVVNPYISVTNRTSVAAAYA